MDISNIFVNRFSKLSCKYMAWIRSCANRFYIFDMSILYFTRYPQSKYFTHLDNIDLNKYTSEKHVLCNINNLIGFDKRYELILNSQCKQCLTYLNLGKNLNKNMPDNNPLLCYILYCTRKIGIKSI